MIIDILMCSDFIGCSIIGVRCTVNWVPRFEIVLGRFVLKILRFFSDFYAIIGTEGGIIKLVG